MDIRFKKSIHNHYRWYFEEIHKKGNKEKLRKIEHNGENM